MDLRGIDLRDANLQRANLQGAYLRDAQLDGAILMGADLSHADLRGASLGKTAKGPAHLSAAILRHTDFRHARFDDTRLIYADLTGADFSYTDLRSVTFSSELKYDREPLEYPPRMDFALPGPDFPLPKRSDQPIASLIPNAWLLAPPTSASTDTAKPYPKFWVFVKPKSGWEYPNCGTYEKPCPLLEDGYKMALKAVKKYPRTVLAIAEGEYKLSETLKIPTNMSVFGAFPRAYQSVGSVNQRSLVHAPPNGAPAFLTTDSSFSMQHLLIFGSDAGAGSDSKAFASEYLSGYLGFSEIVAGRGGVGQTGQEGTKGTTAPDAVNLIGAISPFGGNGGNGG
ncbi:MAG: pentapeptide repeat-containing protein, partial [Bacteroidota bacterium]